MVSVIVPVYNVEPYLRECLDSIIAQTHTNLEIIIIDDGSTDGSGAICDAYAAKDSRIRVIHQENRGLSAARNRGIELASGEYLTFVDSDDYLLPDCIETLLQLCLEYDADLSSCSCVRLESGNSLPAGLNKSVRKPEVFDSPRIMDAWLRRRRLFISAWAKMYRMDLARKIHFPDGRVYEDSFTFFRILHAARRVVRTRKKGYVYRKRSGSIMISPFAAQDLDLLTARLDQIAFMKENYPSLLPYANAELAASCSYLMKKILHGGHAHPDTERQLQMYCRKHWFTYLCFGRYLKSKVFVLAICINLKLAKTIHRICGG